MGGAEWGGPGRNRSRPAKRRRPEQARGKAALHAIPLLHHRAAAPPHSRRSGGGAEGQAEWWGGGMPRPRDELVDDTAPRTHRHDRRGGDCHVHPGAPPNPSIAPHHLPRRRAPRRCILPRVTLLIPNHTAASIHRTCARLHHLPLPHGRKELHRRRRRRSVRQGCRYGLLRSRRSLSRAPSATATTSPPPADRSAPLLRPRRTATPLLPRRRSGRRLAADHPTSPIGSTPLLYRRSAQRLRHAAPATPLLRPMALPCRWPPASLLRLPTGRFAP